MGFLYSIKVKFVLYAIFYSTVGFAQISLDKTRLLLTEKNVREQLNALNATPEFQSYRVSFVDMKMDEQGQLVVAENFSRSAKPFLRIGPRIGKNIPPSNTQKFRVMLRKKPEQTGEYRTHIALETLLPVPENHEKGVLVQANFKYLIPVIVRYGEPTATASIEHAKFNSDSEGGKSIDFVLAREGVRSIYGDIDIIDPQTKHMLKKQKGFGVYPEVNKAKFSIEVSDIKLPSEVLLRFSEDPEFNSINDAIVSEVLVKI